MGLCDQAGTRLASARQASSRLTLSRACESADVSALWSHPGNGTAAQIAAGLEGCELSRADDDFTPLGSCSRRC
jgi:hypothetical protein